MAPDAEPFADQLGDARQRPQVGGLAMGQWASQQLSLQFGQLLGA